MAYAGDPNPFPKHEKDERWTAVDHYALQHLHPSASPYYAALEHALQTSQAAGLPDIAVSPLQGQFLAMQARMLNAKHVLEVGTLGGFSTIWLCSASADLKVTTVEYSEKHAAVARENFQNAGLSDRIEVIVGAGADVLPRLREEVVAGKRPLYDFVFIDADKPSNLIYYQESIQMTRGRGLIIVDNVVRKGLVADAEVAKEDPKIEGARAVIEAAGKDTRLEASTLMQTVGEKNYDGFLMCLVK